MHVDCFSLTWYQLSYEYCICRRHTFTMLVVKLLLLPQAPQSYHYDYMSLASNDQLWMVPLHLSLSKYSRPLLQILDYCTYTSQMLRILRFHLLCHFSIKTISGEACKPKMLKLELSQSMACYGNHKIQTITKTELFFLKYIYLINHPFFEPKHHVDIRLF